MVFSGKGTSLPRISSFDATQSMPGGLPVHRRSITNDSANQIYEVQDPRYQDGSLIEEEMTFEELSSKKKGTMIMTKMHGNYFIYFIISGNNSDNFVLDKHIVRSSFNIIKGTNRRGATQMQNARVHTLKQSKRARDQRELKN